MKRQLFLTIVIIYSMTISAQTPIFNSSMQVTALGNVISQPNEGVTNVIDGDVNTKYIDSQIADGIGFKVYLGAGVSKVATSIEVTTANDVPSRDPVNFEVIGSNGDTGPFTSIATGTIPCNTTRFYSRTFTFSNTNSYSYYEIVYTTQCSAADTYLQISETQLFESSTLGVDDINRLESEISIKPNSSSDIFILNYSGVDDLEKILIVDVTGKVIQQIKLKNFNKKEELNLGNLNSGIYLVKIISDKATVTKKILIK